MHIQPSHPREQLTKPHRRALLTVPGEVLLGSGVLAAWIVAIYVGLALFKRLASSDMQKPSPRSEHRTARSEGRDGRAPHRRSAGYAWPSTS